MGKLFTKAFGVQVLLPLCTLSLSACASLPIGSADYISAAHAASTAKAQRASVLSSGGRTITETAQDQSIASAVETAITGKIPTGHHNVVCFNGKVLITGQVPSKSDIAKATAAASNNVNVKKVWNYLTVAPNETQDQITSDAYLGATTKKRLTDRQMEHLDVNSSNIAVAASKGVIYLIGSNAGSNQVIEEVMTGVKQTEGVKKVVNLIDQ